MEDPGRQSSQKADRQRLEKSRVVPPLALVISLRPSKRLVADVASRCRRTPTQAAGSPSGQQHEDRRCAGAE